MSGQRSIISIGEAFLVEYPDRTVPSGIAIDIAAAAKRFGHEGVPISRLGQDNAAQMVLDYLADRNIDASHLQSDPDLQTGKLVVRSVLGRTTRQLDPKAAFDNLQWDFDLVDVAQQADAVVYGTLAQRGGLSSSTIRRFLDECRKALRICDMTNRDPQQSPQRSVLEQFLNASAGAFVDAEAWSIVQRSGAAMERESIVAMLQAHEIEFLVVVAPDSPLVVHTADEVGETKQPWCEMDHALAVMSFLHGLLRGERVANVLNRVDNVVQYARDYPDEKCIPDELLDGTSTSGT